jgi:hypothetical protein
VKKNPKNQKAVDELRPEYDFSALRNGARGKYAALLTLIRPTKRPRRRTD